MSTNLWVDVLSVVETGDAERVRQLKCPTCGGDRLSVECTWRRKRTIRIDCTHCLSCERLIGVNASPPWVDEVGGRILTGFRFEQASAELSYPTLFIDDAVERAVQEARRPKTRLGAFFLRLEQRLLIVHGRIPHGRTSVHTQLRARNAFPKSDWLQSKCPIEFATGILRILKEQLELPNHFLVPADPLDLLLLAYYYDFPHQSVSHFIKKEFRIEITWDEFRQVHSEGWTVKRFVEYAYAKIE